MIVNNADELYGAQVAMKLTETTVEPGTISAIRFTLAAAFFLPGLPLSLSCQQACAP